jgi:hypothetical protein
MKLLSTILTPCVLLAGAITAQAQYGAYNNGYQSYGYRSYGYQSPQQHDAYRPSAHVQPGRSGWQTVYRYFNPTTGDQLLSVNPRAEDPYSMTSYVDDGTFMISTQGGPGKIPLYRFADPNGMHSFTTSRHAGGYAHLEGALGYIDARQTHGAVPLYGYYDPHWDRHVVTTNPRSSLQHSMQSKGILGYVMPGQGY